MALGNDNQYIEPVHVLLALLNQDGGTLGALLNQSDVNTK